MLRVVKVDIVDSALRRHDFFNLIQINDRGAVRAEKRLFVQNTFNLREGVMGPVLAGLRHDDGDSLF